MASELDYMGTRRGINGGSLLIGILIGAVAGGIAALLLAPQSGKETQQMIRDRMMEAQKMVKDRVSEVKERVGQVRDNMRTRAEQEMQAAEGKRTPG